MKKKVIAVLLSLSLAAGSVPGYAVAEEPGGPEGEIVVIDEGEPVPAAENTVEEDAVIVNDTVEIAGIEELEVPAEDAASEDEPVVTDEIAADVVVVEDPELTDVDTPSTIANVEDKTVTKDNFTVKIDGESITVKTDLGKTDPWTNKDAEGNLKLPVVTYSPVTADNTLAAARVVVTYKAPESEVESTLVKDTDYVLKPSKNQNATADKKNVKDKAVLEIDFKNDGKYRDVPSIFIAYDIKPKDISTTEGTDPKLADGFKLTFPGQGPDGGLDNSYNGEEQKPDPKATTLIYESGDVKESLQYTVKYDPEEDQGSFFEMVVEPADPDNEPNDLVQAGTKKITITGKGNYTGTVEKTYKITKKTAAKDDFNISEKTFYANGAANIDGEKIEEELKKGIKDKAGYAIASTGKDGYELYWKKVDEYNDTEGGKETDFGKIGSFGKYNYWIAFNGDAVNYADVNDGNNKNDKLWIASSFEIVDTAGISSSLEAAYRAADQYITKEYTYGDAFNESIYENIVGSDGAFKKVGIDNAKDRIVVSYLNRPIIPASDAIGNLIRKVDSYPVRIEAANGGNWRVDKTQDGTIKVNPREIGKKGKLDTDNFEITYDSTEKKITDAVAGKTVAIQTQNYNKTWAAPKVRLLWKADKYYGANGVGRGYYSNNGVLKEGTDYTLEYTANTDGKVTSVTIKGIGNYTSEAVVDVVQISATDLSVLTDVHVKDSSNGEANGIDLRYGTGGKKEVDSINIEVKDEKGNVIPYTEYNIENVVGDTCCNNDHVKAGEHYVTIKAMSDGNCVGKKKVYFTIRGKEFSEEYRTDGNVEAFDLKVDTPVQMKNMPHNLLKIVDTGKGNTELQFDRTISGGDANTGDYSVSYYWKENVVLKEDGTFDEAKTNPKYPYLTINSTADTSGGRIFNKTDGKNSSDKVTFGKAGKWVMVVKPNYGAPQGTDTYNLLQSLNGTLMVEFTVKPRDFVEKTDTNKGNIKVSKLGSIDWMSLDTVPEESLAKLLVLTDISESSDKTLILGTDYEIAGVKDNDRVGDATLTLKGKGNYNPEQTIDVTVTINKKSLKEAEVTVKNVDYQGGSKPALDAGDVEVKIMPYFEFVGDRVKVKEDQYEVVVSDAGSYAVGDTMTVTVKALENSNYKEEASVTYKIGKGRIGNKDIFELQGVVSKVYMDEPVEQENMKLVNTKTNEEIAIDPATVKYENNDKVGTATVTVEALDKENYEGTATAFFDIVTSAVANSIDFTFEEGPYTYTGQAFQPAVTKVTDSTGKEIAAGEYEVSYRDNVNAGTAIIAVTVKETTIEKGFTINRAKITDSDVTGVAESYVYDGTVKRPVVTVTVNGTKLEQNKDFRVYNTESTAAGPKELAVQGIGNYEGDVLKKFTVTAAPLAGAVITGVKDSYKYNGTARQPKVKVTLNGKVLKKDVDYKVTYSADSTAVGGKTATIEGTGNYTGSQVKAYSVVPAKAVVSSVTADKKKLTVNVNAQEGVTYQIQYRVNGKTAWSSAKATGTQKVLKGLKAGKKYQIRVRAFATIDGARVNGAWSKVTVKKVK